MARLFHLLGIPLLVGSLIVATILTFFALGLTNPVPWLFLVSIFAIPYFIKMSEKRHFVIWKGKYSVGIPAMDADHKKLLNLINHLQTAIHYQTGDEFEKEALTELLAYTRQHLKHEEELMEEFNYPGLASHRELHNEFIRQAESFVQQYHIHGHEALARLADYLRDWLVHHINGSDQEYGDFIQRSLRNSPDKAME
jgi:hemerythrin-like metal-binding protein